MASVPAKRLEDAPTHFRDRAEAGQYLSQRLSDLSGRSDLLVLGIPRGGVPVAYEVAKALHAPLDVMVVRKLGYPGAEELAMGAIASGGIRVLNQEVLREMPVPQQVIDQVAARELKELRRRERIYRGDRPPLDSRGRTVIVVDDGLATGSSMRAAVTALRRLGPAAIVVGVPAGATSTCRSLAHIVDRLVCVIESPSFFAVGMWYDDFSQTTDEEVRHLLDQLTPASQPSAPNTPAQLRPDFFIEESSKTTTSVLEKSDEAHAGTRSRPGDSVLLSAEDRRLVVRNLRGEEVGTVEPRLATRLVRLMRRGNRYEAGVLSTSHGRITVLIRQASQAPGLGGVPSFHAAAPLHEIDTGPFEKRELGIEASDLEGYREPYQEYELESTPPDTAVIDRSDLLADETDEEKEAEAFVVPDEQEQVARERELVAEEEDLEPES
jgi:putative phosphoribosyl transferase